MLLSGLSGIRRRSISARRSGNEPGAGAAACGGAEWDVRPPRPRAVCGGQRGTDEREGHVVRGKIDGVACPAPGGLRLGGAAK